MMTITLVSETILHNTEGGSDKLYRIQTIKNEVGLYSVLCSSCRRGNAWVDQGTKIADTTENLAARKVQSIVTAKTGKGYRVVKSENPGRELSRTTRTEAPAPPVPVAPAIVYRPQLLNSIEEAEAIKLLKSDAWIVQEKKDGVRQMLSRTNGGPIQASNKLGNFITPDETVIAGMPSYNFVMDGELVGSVYHIFDLLELDKVDLRPMGYEYRYGILKSLMNGTLAGYRRMVSANRVLVEVPVGDAKQTYLESLKSRGAEGLVFKRANAPFKAGRPSSGGDQLKFKFVSTASFIVTRQNEQRSVALALLDGASEIPVGNCTIPANKTVPPVGAIVEVRYLYAYRGGSIYQPTYLGERNDILRDECKVGQLKFKGEGSDPDEE